MAVPSHGALLAITLDPVGAPDTFTTIGELNGDFGFNVSSGSTETTSHNEDMDTYVPNVTRRGTVPVSVNFDPDKYPHHTTLQTFAITKTRFKLRMRAVNGGPGDKEIIYNDGFFESWTEANPVREGVRTAEGTFRPSGSMVVNGVTYPTP